MFVCPCCCCLACARNIPGDNSRVAAAAAAEQLRDKRRPNNRPHREYLWRILSECQISVVELPPRLGSTAFFKDTGYTLLQLHRCPTLGHEACPSAWGEGAITLPEGVEARTIHRLRQELQGKEKLKEMVEILKYR